MDRSKINPNIKDIAKIANVSVTTVSHAISGKRHVSEKTKEKIFKIIKENDYSPNVVARSLKKKESGIIGVITPVLNNEFYSEIIEGIEESLRLKGYMLVINISHFNITKEKEHFRKIDSLFIDGLILVGGFTEISYIDEINKRNIPVVLALREDPQNKYPIVSIDFKKSISNITDFLFKSGHENIGYAGWLREGKITDRKTLDGYIESVKKNGKKFNKSLLIVHTASEDDQGHNFYQFIDTYLKQNGNNRKLNFTALVCQNDYIAIDAINALKKNGFNVPNDISITGFGNIAKSRYHNPSLTTIAIPRKKIGRLSAEVFIKIINKNNISDSDLLLETEIIQRDSTRQL